MTIGYDKPLYILPSDTNTLLAGWLRRRKTW
jgi:hypothetical protein